MSLEKDFLNVVSTTIKIEPVSTFDLYGAPSVGTASTFDAYVEQVHKLFDFGSGRTEVATEVVFVMSSSAAIGLNDKITLPSGRTPKILRVETLDDSEGQHHLEVYTG